MGFCHSSKTLLKVFALISISCSLGSVQGDEGLGVFHPLLGAYSRPRCFALLLIASFLSHQLTSTFTRAQGEVSACSLECRQWYRKPQNTLLLSPHWGAPGLPTGPMFLPWAAAPQPLPGQAPVAAVCSALGTVLERLLAWQGHQPSTWQPCCHPTMPALSSQDAFLSCPGSSQSGGAGVFINRDVCLHLRGQAASRARLHRGRLCPGWRKHLLSPSRWLLSHPRSRQTPKGFPDK